MDTVPFKETQKKHSPRLVLAAHYADKATPWLMPGLITPLWVDSPWGLVGFTPAALVYVASGMDWVLHRGQLCEACAVEMPLNGTELVEKWRGQLRGHHWLAQNLVLATVAVLAGMAALTFTVGVKWAVTAAILFFAAVALVGARHVKVRPWCPWCQWGGGGGEERTPIIPPSPTVSH